MDSMLVTLKKIITVLEDSDETDWLNSFKEITKDYENLTDIDNKRELKRELLGIYGGMGSFSDLVLYKDNRLLHEENNKLDLLRRELFEIINESL